MQNWWVLNAWETGPIYLVAWVFWVIFSIVLHELGHGWAAIRQGDTTPIETGHMTWNPLVHMGQTSLIMFALVGIAWGQMPVSPSRFRGRYGDAYVSFAGPFMNLLLFIACSIGGVVYLRLMSTMPEGFAYNLLVFLERGAVLNLALMLFNLLPVPPLDGSRILGDFWPKYYEMISTERGQMFTFIAFVVTFMYAGGKIFSFAAHVNTELWFACVRLLGGGGAP
ncbi:MAG: site-2 protease family protein [Phycisphaerales bacterium]